MKYIDLEDVHIFSVPGTHVFLCMVFRLVGLFVFLFSSISYAFFSLVTNKSVW